MKISRINKIMRKKGFEIDNIHVYDRLTAIS